MKLDPYRASLVSVLLIYFDCVRYFYATASIFLNIEMVYPPKARDEILVLFVPGTLPRKSTSKILSFTQ